MFATITSLKYILSVVLNKNFLCMFMLLPSSLSKFSSDQLSIPRNAEMLDTCQLAFLIEECFSLLA